MSGEHPGLTNLEERALVNLGQFDEPKTISELENETGIRSKYWTRSWQKLEPKNLIKRDATGRTTQLKLTREGQEAARLLTLLQQVLE